MGEQTPKGLSAEDDKKAKDLYSGYDGHGAAADDYVINRDLSERHESPSPEKVEILKDVLNSLDKAIDYLNNEPSSYGYDRGVLEDPRYSLMETRKTLESYLKEMPKAALKHRHRSELGKMSLEENMNDARQHFRENEEGYKERAVNEAQERGIDVNYPPYTDPQPGSETTPGQPQ